MKSTINRVLSLSLLLVSASASLLESRSAVYDMVLRRSLLAVMEKPENRSLATAFSAFGSGLREKNDNEKIESNLFGTLIDARYYFPSWWVEGVIAPLIEVRKISDYDDRTHDECDDECHRNVDPRFAIDDILLYLGKDFINDELNQLSLYGVVGIPTTDADPNVPLVGTGHWAIGGGFDAEYGLYDEDNRAVSIIGSGRLIHTFRRRADVRSENSTVKVVDRSERNATLKFDIGNRFDALVALHYAQGCHSIEFGYNPTVSFGGRARLNLDDQNQCPNTFDVADHDSRVRHTVYGQYLVIIPLKGNCPLSVGLGLSYGFFDGNRAINARGHNVTGWLSASLNY